MTDEDRFELIPLGSDGLAEAEKCIAEGRYDEALSLLDADTGAHAEQREAAYLRTFCLRALARWDSVQSVVLDLMNSHPRYGRAYQELGFLNWHENKLQEAHAAFKTAVTLNNGLITSFRALAQIELDTGHPKMAAQSKSQIERLSTDTLDIATVTCWSQEGWLEKAETLCRQVVEKFPKSVEAKRLLADIFVRGGRFSPAADLLTSILETDPTALLAGIDLVNLLHRRNRFADALTHAERLAQAYPEIPLIHMLHANELAANGFIEQALSVFERVIQKTNGNPSVQMMYGHTLRSVGRSAAAVAAYRAAIEVNPGLGEAYFSLSNMKTYEFPADDLQSMQNHLDNPSTSVADRTYFNFALGQAYENTGDLNRAFEYFRSGNAAMKQHHAYNADAMSEEFEAQKRAFTSTSIQSLSTTRPVSPTPIFIVGLPRAGSTLIEQVLASHSDVDGTMELPHIPDLVEQIRRGPNGYPAGVFQLSQHELEDLAAGFMQESAPYRGTAPMFTDKMPNNFRHIGLIKTLLPNARIIDARRHPLDCGVSLFKQLFAEGQEYSYSLSDIGRYYSGYLDLMDHWQSLYPDSVLTVKYEDMVSDLEHEVRRMLTFLELPFQDTCLRFHETSRTVQTASSEQVRQPLYASSVGIWRKYETHLAPLIEALGPHAPLAS